MTLAYFCLGGLELLGALDTVISEQNKQDWIDWIYSQQILPSDDEQSKKKERYMNIYIYKQQWILSIYLYIFR